MKKVFNFLLILISISFGFFIFFLVFFKVRDCGEVANIGASLLASAFTGFVAGGAVYCVPTLSRKDKKKKEEEEKEENKKKWTDNYKSPLN